VVLCSAGIGFAQVSLSATTTANVNVRAGAGTQHPDIGDLAANAAIIVEGRNEAGDWVLMRAGDLRGWVAARFLTFAPDADLNALAVSAEQFAAVDYGTMDAVRAAPIIPRMTGRGYAIYEAGRALGNDPQRFSKVGDCQNVSQFFLGNFDRGAYSLGSYANLQPTISYFAGSWGRDSASVSNGFNIYSTLDPSWAGTGCLSGENPLECEYRLWRPSFVIVSLEITYGLTAQGYAGALRQILDYWIENGVVPIVATKPDNREGDWSVNAAIARVAWEYDVPLWNFLMATQPLPDFGLSDGFHLTFAPDDFSDPTNLQFGWAQRNLTALQTLHAIRTAVS
jgi:hypothetical protein